MKKYWFTLFPDTFLWVKDHVGLIYNVGKNIKVKFANKGELAEITKKLLDINNLYCIEVAEDVLEHENISAWVHEIVDSGCGNLVLDDGMTKRPLSLPPVLKVQDDAEYYKWEHKQNIDGNVIQNLQHLAFYINGSEYGNDLYSKQALYPVKSKRTLDTDKIRWFAMNARCSSFLSEISLIGNPLKISGLADMVYELQKICTVNLYVTIQDIASALPRTKELLAMANLHLLVTDYTLLGLLADIESGENEISYTFIVTSGHEYETALEYTEERNLKNANIVPVYTGDNFHFFEDYLFVDEEDLQDIALSKRDIFIRQTLNVFNFGSLSVMPDGKVYSNLNHLPVGTIDEAPHSIVYREMTEGHSWLDIRDQPPCCNCVYQWLCPSPSNYERVIGRPDFCRVGH